MTTPNPYSGQQGMEWYDLAWGQGYEYGQQNPAQDQPPMPTVFPPLPADTVDDQYLGYMQQVWSEGALAGRTDFPVAAHPVHPGDNALEYAGHATEGTVLVAGLIRGGLTAVELSAAAVEVFVMIIGMTEPDDASLAQEALQSWFVHACDKFNCKEFFLPVVWPYASGNPGWYGHVHDSFDPARDEAAEYLAQNPGHAMQVAHYSADSPGAFELIDLESS